MKEEYLVKTEEDLREVLGHPSEKVLSKVGDRIDEHSKAFIELSPLVFLSTCDAYGNQFVSPKGDGPGFVKVQDEKTLLIPERPGNKMTLGFMNIVENGKAGLIFTIPGVVDTFRVSGEAFLSKDPELLQMLEAQGKPALLCTILKVEQCFMHCGKAFVRSKLWDSSTWPSDGKGIAARQLAGMLDMEKEDIEKGLADAYKNKLY